MNYIEKMRPQVAALFLLGLCALNACKKPETELGLGLQPEDELLNVTVIDTVSFIMYSELDDSLRTDELSNNLIGSYYDSEFGLTSASSFFQFRMEGENVQFDAPNITLDSVVLSLEYSSYYGELDQQTFAVYEIIDTLNIDSNYYTNSFANFDSIGVLNPQANLIEPGFETLIPDPINPTYVTGDTLDPQLRLRLRNSWGQKILDADPNTELLTNEQFVEFMHGLHVRSENIGQGFDQGAILYFNPLDAASKITLYYHEAGDPDQKEFDLDINDKCARFTKTKHAYTGTSVGLALADTTLGQNACYIQSLSGVRTKINFPHIMDLADSGLVAINKAEIILPVEYYSQSNFFPNQNVSALRIDDDGDLQFLPDYFYGTAPISESYDIDAKEFRFGIGGFLQSVLTGDITDPTIILETNQSSVSANRCILSGPNTINRRKPRLEITYTKY